MGLIEDTVGLTMSNAREQWRQVAVRVSKPRQVRYVPIELILCMALFRILRPNGYGGGNIHTAPQQVHVLASTLKRSPSSLISKMLNLQGARENAATDERDLYWVLSEPGRLDTLYTLVLDAARAEGFMEDRVPEIVTPAK